LRLERIGLANQHHALAAFEGPVAGLGEHLADEIDLDRRPFVGLEHHHVDVHAAGNAIAGAAFAARINGKIAGCLPAGALAKVGLDRVEAVDGLGGRSGHGPLANAGRPRKQQGGRQRFALDRARQQRRQAPMTDEVAQGHVVHRS